jgi:hypothetical protein
VEVLLFEFFFLISLNFLLIAYFILFYFPFFFVLPPISLFYL